ncbi:ABC transporter permease [Sulfitobacter pseudonitzschiae]|uniref:Spermidine/putrescine transport system permease protein PotC n=1 Tax=Pseudosulfitobacter pseudonitzschiae TaxID=1402135 RepID=A0A9Q2NHN5_9RHOB|nr:ABC transporter permease [Pseudosulfitobacter pseudonitzschiae]MBM2290912.1 ABC transporter permease [Pseudosulfitobacter pseudonitzschiae]MBM2295830.1 ABC transporter permease [Pseudosulfitobacter pseudonitzschiae]MBM2300743.1 ABC transporter permease [Pseudosulfitobacter pseudonitzschiae]MBM2310527.1 ABC transporter permease [Pseudosulfitobacter pseudonitzschiae]MBM2315440.1 ABC transporter permease [Pseudosulfitobacter pseudonitzschiae]
MAKRFQIQQMPGFRTIAVVTFVLLYMPIFLLVIYSFNAGTSIAIWEGFSWRWYVSAWDNQQVQEATIRSLVIAFWASVISTTLAVLAALATTRTRKFKGQAAVFAMINQPLMVPEIVTAVALLIFFAMIKVATGYTGLMYLVIAHTAFCIPFAYLPIRARLIGMDLALEQAAADLYAPPFRVFTRITLPQLWPGILAGAMLAFVISLDDVVITEFVKSAGQDTLPTYMLGQLRRVVTPEVNAISTVLLGISVTMVVAFTALSKLKT